MLYEGGEGLKHGNLPNLFCSAHERSRLAISSAKFQASQISNSRMRSSMQAKPYLKSVTLLKPEDKLHKYPFNIPALRAMETLEFHPDVTFLIGENGSGKSTLLEAIAILMDCGAQGGTGNFKLDDPSGLSELWCYLRPRRSY